MISQDDRLGILHAPGADLVLVRFEGAEAINTLGQIEVECLSETGNVDFTMLLGRNVSIEMKTIDPGHPPRFFDGLLTEARETRVLWGGMGYKLMLRPWLWLLSLRRNQKIFHNKTAPEIIEEIFAEYGKPHETLLQRDYPVLEYTVQYAESDLDFVTRLMAAYGINHTVRHDKGMHEIVLFDDVDSLPEVIGGKRPLRQTDRQYRDDAEHLQDWSSERRMTTGRVAMVDYNFKKPRSAMDAEEAGNAGHAHDDLELFLFPGGYPDQGEGQSLAKIRMQQMLTSDGHHFAQGDCLGLGPGMRTGLSGHERPELNARTYLVLAVQHDYTAEGYRSGSGATAPRDSYNAYYEFAETTAPVAPPAAPATTPRLHGPQTAVVVGSGEIDCDEYGRILVEFHWDRDGAKSMRCRVAQLWAGRNWGAVFIPRVGMEVIVEFLNGDPSAPIVTGCVYNDDNMPPYELPGDNMISGVKSQSTPGGGGYNELIFDDCAGVEEIRIHAQYNFNAKVLNNRSATIDVDDLLTVGETRSTIIGQDDKLVIGETLTVTAGQKITLEVGMSRIEIDSTSITLTAPTVEIKAAREFRSEAGLTSEHQAGAIFNIQGGIVKIN